MNAALLSKGAQQRGALVHQVLARRGVVVGDDAKAARRRLERDVAEGFGRAREQEDVGRGVVRRERAVHQAAGDDVADIAPAQLLGHRAVADQHQPDVRPRRAHRLVGLDYQREVLLGREAAHAQRHRRVLGRAPARAQLRRALGRREDLRIHAAADDAQALESALRQRFGELGGRHHGAVGAVVEAAQVARTGRANQEKP